MRREYVVIVDSMADFPVGFKNPDIRIVKTPVFIGKEEWTYEDLDNFYSRQRVVLKKGHEKTNQIKTSAPYVVDINREMQAILESGRDAVYIATASSLTSAFSSGMTACNLIDEEGDYKNRAIVLDGLSMSALTSVLVRAALKKTETTNELIDFIFDRRNDTEHFFAFEDWGAARGSGRISETTLLIADLIGVKPLLRFDFDETGVRKAFCEKKGRSLKALAAFAAKRLAETIDPEFPVATIVNADNPAGATLLADSIRKFAPNVRIMGDPLLEPEFRMGHATGVHLGYSAIGLAFLRRKGIYENVEKHRLTQELSDAKFEL